MMPYRRSQSSRASGSSRGGSVGGFRSQPSVQSVYGDELLNPDEDENPQAVLFLMGRNGGRTGSQGNGPQPPRFENRLSPNAHGPMANGPSTHYVSQTNCTNHFYYLSGDGACTFNQQHTPESGAFNGSAFGRGFGNAFGGAAFADFAPGPAAFGGGNSAHNFHGGQNFPHGNAFQPQRGFGQQPQQGLFNNGGNGPFSQPRQNQNLQDLPQDDVFGRFFRSGGSNNGSNNNGGCSQTRYGY